MKKCTRCKEEKSFESFSIKGNRKKDNSIIYQDFCKNCQNEYTKKWYIENKEKHKRNTAILNKKNFESIRYYIYNYLKDKECIDCKSIDFRTFQFDHRDRNNKVSEISTMVKNRVRLELIKLEINKCDIRCANCHIIKTGIENNAWWTKL
jgi:hypothetical protein